jgi:GT2 family glycosyltransferase
MDQINTKFAIAIPTINRWDLLQETLKKYEKDFPNTLIMVVDNGNQIKEIQQKNVLLISNSENFGVSKSWNQMLIHAFLANEKYKGINNSSSILFFDKNPQDYVWKIFQNVLVLNDDVYLGKTEAEIISFIDNNQFSLATTTLTWCAFIISRETYLRVGPFDEEIFPAYFEDNDYAYRLKLEGIQHSCYEFLNPQTFINSGSIAKDPSLNTNFEKNRRYYISKWGGEPEKEIFKTPFNL